MRLGVAGSSWHVDTRGPGLGPACPGVRLSDAAGPAPVYYSSRIPQGLSLPSGSGSSESNFQVELEGAATSGGGRTRWLPGGACTTAARPAHPSARAVPFNPLVAQS